MTLYQETPCGHGYMESHYTCDHIGYPEYNQMPHTNENCWCPGGSREEVTIDLEAIALHLHFADESDRLRPADYYRELAESAIHAALGTHTERETASTA